jgi:osmotically-inducible protein OsmY
MNAANLTVKSRLAPWLVITALVPTLAGCFGAAVVGVGAGALMMADRRPTETYVTDEGIELRAVNRLRERFGDNIHVNVTSFNRSALLTGEVPSAAVKAEVEKLLGAVPNLKSVSNELQVAGVSSLAARSNDSYITSKVKARFVDANRFGVNHVKVITEANTVYLLGLVTREEADAAVEIARTTAGVMKVVRVFEYLSADDARRLDYAPGAAPAGQTAPTATASPAPVKK